MAPQPPLRVGIVPYLNMLPLVRGLESLALPGSARRLEVVPAPPSQMAQMLDRGELDLGMAPTAAVLSRPDWRVVGRSMIGSRGPVRSVLAFSLDSPERWTLLHPDAQSRTSNVLARVLLSGAHGVRPALGPPIPLEGWEPPARPAPGEAFLLIGTRAIRWRALWSAQRATALDLGEAWTRWTGLPFVFAVWALRPGAPVSESELADWLEAFEALKARNAARLGEIVPAWPGLAEERQTSAEAIEYLTRNIDFDLDSAARQGLARFGEEGRRLGLFPA